MLRLVIPLALMSVVACAAASEPAPAAAATLAAAERAPTAARATEIAADAASPVSCEIYRARTLRGLRLEARAAGFEEAPGAIDYEFIVTKTDSNGSSDIVQVGEVSEPMLGSVDLNVERGARYRATLSLRNNNREVCAAEFRS